MEQRTEVRTGPWCLIDVDGSRITTERVWTYVDDWRDTALGHMNFGFVHLGPVQIVRKP